MQNSEKKWEKKREEKPAEKKMVDEEVDKLNSAERGENTGGNA